MKAVGVRELKAKLSEYLRLARSGETILVTDRSEVVAELGPSRRQFAAGDEWDEIFDALADEGKVTRARLPKKGWEWKPQGLGLPPGTAQEILEELRKDFDEE